MAVCEACDKEMLVANSCNQQEIMFPDGQSLPVIKAQFLTPDVRCRDCNVVDGGIHHPGCDQEKCPRCGEQLIFCGCLDE